jgi:hypothetical protein
MRQLVLVAAVAALAGCDLPPTSCSLVGCSDGTRLPLLEHIDAMTIAGSTVRLCIGEHCSSATLSESDPPAFTVPFTGELPGGISVWSHDPGYDVLVEITQRGPLGQTDRFDTVVTASDGTEINARSWAVTYVDYWPDGEGCFEPCRQGVVADMR